VLRRDRVQRGHRTAGDEAVAAALRGQHAEDASRVPGTGIDVAGPPFGLAAPGGGEPFGLAFGAQFEFVYPAVPSPGVSGLSAPSNTLIEETTCPVHEKGTHDDPPSDLKRSRAGRLPPAEYPDPISRRQFMNVLRGRNGTRTGAVALGALITMSIATIPASASVTSVSFSTAIPLPNNIDFSPGTHPVILKKDLTLQAGESRRVSDTLVVTLSSSEGAEVDNVIECLDAGNPGKVKGAQVGIAAASGTNHQGSGVGELWLRASLLFTAPYAGTFTCQIRTYTGDGDRLDYHATAVGGPLILGTPTKTGLVISNADEVGSHWWQNATCTSDGTVDGKPDPNCVYLGAPGDPTRVNVFQDGAPHYEWTAASGASVADVTATMQITSCPSTTRSCTDGQKGDTDTARVRTHLEFVQLDSHGNFCKVNSTGDTLYDISNHVHHKVINYDLPNVQISSTCGGSRRFLLRVVLVWVSGNPVKIDSGSQPDYHSSTNANVINSVLNTTSRVPWLLNMSQAAAQSALTAADLTLGTVTSVDSSAAPGTVIDQNAPTGTVEPAGSPVNLTVSKSAIVVPNVTSLPLSQAISALRAAGLGDPTQHTAVDANCNEPIGTVTGQSPTAGTLEPAGFSVNLQIEAWPTRGCSTN
jgi:hypothetical protein